MRLGRWFVGLGALLVAGLALYVLTGGFSGRDGNMLSAKEGDRGRRGSAALEEKAGIDGPPLDEIDAKSRDAMRELLRKAGSEAGEE